MTQRPWAMQNFSKSAPVNDFTRRKLTPVWIQDAAPSILLIGTDNQPYWMQSRDMRFLGAVSIEDAPEKLAQTARVDIVVLDCTNMQRETSSLSQALSTLSCDTSLIVVSRIETLDADYALLDCRDAAQWLCDPTPADYEDALAIALTPFAPSMLHDPRKDRTQAQLQHLSEEVERLSKTLDALHQLDGSAGGHNKRPATDEGTGKTAVSHDGRLSEAEKTLTAAIARDLLRARRQRDHFLGHDLFADPAWDMILDLMAARLAGERVSVSSLCIAAAVPPTTALRWIRHLTQRGLFERRPDTQDGRRVFIALSDKTAAAVHRWYAVNFPLRREGYD